MVPDDTARVEANEPIDSDSLNDESVLVSRALTLATDLIEDANSGRSRREHSQAKRINRLLRQPQGLAFILSLTDEVLRIHEPRRGARRLRDLVRAESSLDFLGPLDRILLMTGSSLAQLVPRLVMPLVSWRIRSELSGFVISADGKVLSRHIARRREQGIRVNVNLLGEAVLGEAEAQSRLRAVRALLERTDVEYVSVKISSICAQINPGAFDDELERIAQRLRSLYDTAMRFEPPKFVNLDMEEYRDLELTVAAFQRVLGDERYARLDAGIVLQAYLPDSFQALQLLIPWARVRYEHHGGRIKIRIVKGANLAMETVIGELAGWEVPIYATKSDVDANYKRMLELVLEPKNKQCIRVGVASHNVFEVSWAIVLADAKRVPAMIEIEMLEGMAVSIARAVRKVAGGMLLYTPIAHKADSDSVIAYLVRRFDENTGPENFLTHQFSLEPGSPTWETEKLKFTASVLASHEPTVPTRWTQDREHEHIGLEDGLDTFTNEPDTDFSLSANRTWIGRYLGSLEDLGIDLITPVIGGRGILAEESGLEPVVARDPFEPQRVAYRWVPANETLADEAIATAKVAGEEWRSTPLLARKEVLLKAARELARQRGQLVGVMARDAGKVLREGDVEVSEAIDLVRYYALCIDDLVATQKVDLAFTPFGTVLVVPPWNFPVAIPVGGVAAALAAGNAVILKPAPETVAVAWVFVNAFWSAGVSKELLQFVPCTDGDVGRYLVTHRDVNAVVLTGSWETARMFLGWRPELELHAETSGKNAIIVTAAADMDNAVSDLITSAFGHAGQKCSAASLAIIEASVYDDHDFRRRLVDAARTRRLGAGWDTRSTIGPLIRPPEGALADALQHLGAGEEWLLEPRALDGNVQLVTPGIRLGVLPGSEFHLHECFGPILGLMRARDLEHAIQIQNSSLYGLTAGLHSLDAQEIRQWTASVQAGNLYVNRPITGAIVQRQPFGGWKRSVLGPGAKAGGPNYVATLGTWSCRYDGDVEMFEEAVRVCFANELGPVDPSGLLAEANIFRYVTSKRVLLRVGGDVADETLSLVLAAGRAAGVDVELSSPSFRETSSTMITESAEEMIVRLSKMLKAGEEPEKVRLLGVVEPQLRLDIIDLGVTLDSGTFVAHPSFEARRWCREQALSVTMHRHGNVTGRSHWVG